MKLVKQSFEKDSSGYTTLVPQDKEDLWQLYNLIQKQDDVKIQTFRNVSKKSGLSAVGGKDKGKQERKMVTLRLNVEDVEYNPSDESMRIRGKTTEPNEYVPIQSYHTGEVQLTKPITVYKHQWDQINYNIVIQSCSIEAKAEVGAIVFEEGIAHLCLITDNMTVLKTKIEKSIPKKRRGDNSNYEKGLNKFYDLIITTMLRNFDLDKLKVVILTSPGFMASSLLAQINAYAQKNDDKDLFRNKFKFVVAHSSTGYLQGLQEALQDPHLQKKLSDTKFTKQVQVFEEFEKNLNEDNDKAWYGRKECEQAIELGAVKYLMITDSLFRNDDISVRKFYIDLTEQVKHSSGEVLIFSSLHDSGKQLDALTGIAVLLSYPVPDLDEEEEE
ncbi:Translation factor pelota [Yamadazyma tenuis]|uniref:Protein DOM34 homolog n=1 Tax=Candida tenuis (strain ATCC 10573 / BCRC 21748 / CBS 615 / JCM 9827 / NBRC 10315 / NRRL Y-1498 / VKM Y-70) TaxID=590646 RepID=G3B791_CANTC|nr:uncharacterized protein CANTEDRAFT_109220 [Yamadazyma tenuis ATCC 10573]EGV61597.1 hypothetical protein CANTEDRAFT_109220 [Yamadazyma tenuis ATCC 10573]WEJ92819.1 Translation factor pelota [Yamadazyma tenuis]